jgi:hypothetical protein
MRSYCITENPKSSKMILFLRKKEIWMQKCQDILDMKKVTNNSYVFPKAKEYLGSPEF